MMQLAQSKILDLSPSAAKETTIFTIANTKNTNTAAITLLTNTCRPFLISSSFGAETDFKKSKDPNTTNKIGTIIWIIKYITWMVLGIIDGISVNNPSPQLTTLFLS